AWNLWGEERAIEFVDPSIRDSCSDQSSVMRCMNVGLLCVQDSPKDRPILSIVVLMLESDTVILPTPRQAAFTMRRSTDNFEVLISRNYMTNTMVVGR
ncbi:S-receptor-like serine/threonine-protein kinase, partial [Thalictrum thalictroides]